MTRQEPIIAVARAADGSPMTGVTDLYVTIQRPSDGFWWDFNDNTFKAVDSVVQRRHVLTEVDATRAPGQYRYLWTVPDLSQIYEVTVEQTPGTSVKNMPLVGSISSFDYTQVATSVLDEPLSGHTVPGSLATEVAAIYAARLSLAEHAVISDDMVMVRKALFNRLELAEGDTNNWVLYDDDKTTPLFKWHVRDKDGKTIVSPGGTAAQQIPSWRRP